MHLATSVESIVWNLWWWWQHWVPTQTNEKKKRIFYAQPFCPEHYYLCLELTVWFWTFDPWRKLLPSIYTAKNWNEPKQIDCAVSAPTLSLHLPTFRINNVNLCWYALCLDYANRHCFCCCIRSLFSCLFVYSFCSWWFYQLQIAIIIKSSNNNKKL